MTFSPKLQFVTFTGADDATTYDQITEIIESGRVLGVKVEIACLMSLTREPGTPRYPTPAKAYALLRHARSLGAESIAYHVCGKAAELLLKGDLNRDEWGDFLQPLSYTAMLGRIQINAAPALTTPESLLTARNALHKRGAYQPHVIGQHRDPDSWPEDFDPGCEIVLMGQTKETRDRSIQYLYDCSGGRGVAPSSWPVLPINRLVGLAGGLGPSGREEVLVTYEAVGATMTNMSDLTDAIPQGNPALESVLAHINAAPPGAKCWIDMESGVRVMDGATSVFSPQRCIDVMEHGLLRKLARS